MNQKPSNLSAISSREMCRELNNISLYDKEGQKDWIKRIFNTMDWQDIAIRPPFICSNAEKVHFKGNAFINSFCCIENSTTDVYIGDYVRIGPNVTITAINHSMDPEKRKEGVAERKPINIGNNVWIGANCVILPGVSIGENTVIGAGSVVTKDIPGNVVAYGNPCIVRKQND